MKKSFDEKNLLVKKRGSGGRGRRGGRGGKSRKGGRGRRGGGRRGGRGGRGESGVVEEAARQSSGNSQVALRLSMYGVMANKCVSRTDTRP